MKFLLLQDAGIKLCVLSRPLQLRSAALLWSAMHLNVKKYVVMHEHSSSWKKRESNQSAFQKGGKIILRDSVCLMDSINSGFYVILCHVGALQFSLFINYISYIFFDLP